MSIKLKEHFMNLVQLQGIRKSYSLGGEAIHALKAVSYTHLTLPTN